ncbi:acetyl-CoA hydrolase/transferase C-terminal domain-containing protein [Sporichthya brevicatena]|uniref:Acetyl-CoA hydrolase/transferase C-terminal domain-containing protein n=1 Tax=Sporichthya brevicatena TaxID=171442 RepID=A0ABP3RQW4_9ACTN
MTALRTSSISDAISRLPRGAHVVAAPGMGAPSTLVAEIGRRADDQGWTLSSGLFLDEYPFLDAVVEGRLSYRTWHVMPPVRKAVAAGLVEYLPVRASRLAHLLSRWSPDVALVRVGPPDPRGYCSLGASAGYGRPAVRNARIVIAEVDPSVPRTFGETMLHHSEIDILVESATPVPLYRAAVGDELTRLIAQHVRTLLPRELTLQIGVGGVPESLIRSLGEDPSGIDSMRIVGMATDDMVDLFASGLLRHSDVVPEPAILSPDMMATQRLLEFAHQNPSIGMYSSAVAHDPYSLGRRERFYSVNTALEVDLSGNVNSEVMRGEQLSGPGGSLDYVDAATRSCGGRRIIALPSTTSDGSRSRIVPRLDHVTIPRSMTDVVVTEYGVAELEGRSLAERARLLIEIAHPDQRSLLAETLR